MDRRRNNLRNNRINARPLGKLGNRRQNRPNRLLRRRPRRQPRPNRNRLSRAQYNFRRNRLGQKFNNNSRRRRIINFRRNRINPRSRIIFVGNLPFDVTGRRLRQLFNIEGRILDARIIRGRNGSKGYGFIEFNNPRDAWRSIRRWNNTYLGGRYITVQYRKRRRIGQRNNFNNFNNQRNNNQFRRGNFGGFRPRGGRRY